MSFLDELKKQAEAVRSRLQVDDETFLRHARATDEACKATFHYWLELIRQLEVLRPPVPGRSTVVEVDAARVGTPLLDELAKWWLGEPNGFTAAGRTVRILDPR